MKNSLQNVNNLQLINYIKTLCIIFVIIDHCSLLDGADPIYLFFVRMAVPIFIFISGYNYSQSFEKRNAVLYSFAYIKRKVLRFLIPAIITCTLYIFLIMLNGNTVSFEYVLTTFFYGYYGLGAYYCNIMLQFIFVFPLFFLCIKKWNELGVVIIAFFNLIYELSYKIHNWSYDVYRILLFRYSFIIALGIYLYLNKNKSLKHTTLLSMFIIGIIYLLLPNYFGYSYHLFTSWQNTSMVVGLYIFPIMYFLFKEFSFTKSFGKFNSIICLVSNSTYHIMYTQMLYFTLKEKLYLLIFDFSKYGILIESILAIFISLISGIFFYKIDNIIFKNLCYSES